MKKNTLSKSHLSILKLIIYLFIISALCFLTCLFSGAHKESSAPEEISWTLSSE